MSGQKIDGRKMKNSLLRDAEIAPSLCPTTKAVSPLRSGLRFATARQAAMHFNVFAVRDQVSEPVEQEDEDEKHFAQGIAFKER